MKVLLGKHSFAVAKKLNNLVTIIDNGLQDLATKEFLVKPVQLISLKK